MVSFRISAKSSSEPIVTYGDLDPSEMCFKTSKFSVEKTDFKNAVCKMALIVFRFPCVEKKTLYVPPANMYIGEIIKWLSSGPVVIGGDNELLSTRSGGA